MLVLLSGKSMKDYDKTGFYQVTPIWLHSAIAVRQRFLSGS